MLRKDWHGWRFKMHHTLLEIFTTGLLNISHTHPGLLYLGGGSAFLKVNMSCAQSPLTFGSANMLYSIKRHLTRTFIAVLCLHITSCTCPTWRQNAVKHKILGSRLVDFNLLPSCPQDPPVRFYVDGGVCSLILFGISSGPGPPRQRPARAGRSHPWRSTPPGDT